MPILSVITSIPIHVYWPEPRGPSVDTWLSESQAALTQSEAISYSCASKEMHSYRISLFKPKPINMYDNSRNIFIYVNIVIFINFWILRGHYISFHVSTDDKKIREANLSQGHPSRCAAEGSQRERGKLKFGQHHWGPFPFSEELDQQWLTARQEGRLRSISGERVQMIHRGASSGLQCLLSICK